MRWRIDRFGRYRWVLGADAGTLEMRVISDAIREGAEGFLYTQYRAIAQVSKVHTGHLSLAYAKRAICRPCFSFRVPFRARRYFLSLVLFARCTGARVALRARAPEGTRFKNGT